MYIYIYIYSECRNKKKQKLCSLHPYGVFEFLVTFQTANLLNHMRQY